MKGKDRGKKGCKKAPAGLLAGAFFLNVICGPEIQLSFFCQAS